MLNFRKYYLSLECYNIHTMNFRENIFKIKVGKPVEVRPSRGVGVIAVTDLYFCMP